MRIILGIVFILMALGLFKIIIIFFIALFSFLRERAIGKAVLYLLGLLLQVGLAVVLINTGLGFFRSPSSSHEKETASEFIAAINSANEASRVVNRGSPFSIMNDRDAGEMINSYRSAITHAKKVDKAVLNQKFPGWGDHFEKEFITGLRLVIEGNEKVDIATSISGQKLLDSWGDWFNAHIDEIRKLK